MCTERFVSPPIPNSDESMSSWINRLVNNENIAYSDLHRLLELRSNTCYSYEYFNKTKALSVLSAAVGIGQKYLKGLTVHSITRGNEYDIVTKHSTSNRTIICPYCLKKDAYYRLSWNT